jgi:hypothetical protein
LKACPKISPSFLAYISDFPVSVAYSTVALIRRDNARPKSFDVNFTALKERNTNQPQERLLTIQHNLLYAIVSLLKDAADYNTEHVFSYLQ